MIKSPLLFLFALVLSPGEALGALHISPYNYLTQHETDSYLGNIIASYLDNPEPRVIETALKILLQESPRSTIKNFLSHATQSSCIPSLNSLELSIVPRKNVKNWQELVDDIIFAADNLNDHHTHLLLMLYSKPIGYAAYTLRETKAKIEYFSIATGIQKQGYGKFFLENLKKKLFINGCTSITLDALPHAYEFYEKLGFERSFGWGISHSAHNPYLASASKNKRKRK